MHDHSGLNVPHVTTARTAYWRFHGPPRAARGECYGQQRLASAAHAILKATPAGAAIFAFFNNDANACAPADAQALQQLLLQSTTK